MMRSSGYFGILAGGALLCLAGAKAIAAERVVPGDYTTISAAIAAASDGDTIRIADSGIYVESLVVDIDLAIVADAGQRPTLRSGEGAARTIHYRGDQKTLTIGSADGGRLTIQPGTSEAIYGRGGGTLSITNTTFNGFPGGDTTDVIYADHVGLSLHLDDVLVEGDGNARIPVYFRQRLLDGDRPSTGSAGSSLTIRNSTFRDLSDDSIGIYFRPEAPAATVPSTVEITSTIVEAGRYGFYGFGGSGPHDIKITDSVLRAGGGAAEVHAFQDYDNQVNVTATRSVFEATTTGNAIYKRDEPAGAGSTFTIDHCDLIATGWAPAVMFAAPDSAITIENSIVVAPSESPLVRTTALRGNPSSTETSRNNALSAEVLHDNAWAHQADNVDMNPRDPNYFNRAGFDYRLRGPEVLFAASTTGGVVGANFDFINGREGPREPMVEETGKTAGAFYPRQLIDAALASAAEGGTAAQARDRIVGKADRWLQIPDEELWSWVFGPSITRSWMVWSDGEDPETGDPILMYDWEIDPFKHPWKVKSPVTGKLYPTNDFKAFYESGLDERGFFDPELADRSLLYNENHPDPEDPLHLFGVDDGEGYVEGDKRWRFIGAYLIYGQWKRRIVNGITQLAEAHMVTGDPVYARKAGILLDRAADIFPEFDFAEQGLVYEKPGRAGTVSTWHDAAREIRVMALAYDQIFEAMSQDEEMVEFLAAKAEEHNLENPKRSFADIQRNIEERLFQHTLRNPHQIETNFPGHLITLLIIETVLEWPANRDHVVASLEDILDQSLEYDGLTGERGIQGYTRGFPGTMAELLSRVDRLDPAILPALFDKFPDLHKTWRFFIDTKIMDLYYPAEGDSGLVGRRYIYEELDADGNPTPPPHHYYYFGISLPRSIGTNVETCMYRFLWRLYEITGDPDYVKVIWNANGETLEELPKDVYASDQVEFRRKVSNVLEEEGRQIILGDINWEDWGISILRAGNGPESMAVSLLHHVSGRHQHSDGLNLELFYKGVNLLPDLGYPAVAYVNEVPRVRYDWVKDVWSHNTVVVDGRKRHVNNMGQATLWADGDDIHAVRVEAPLLYEIDRYERLVVMMEIGGNDAYILDLFTVEGGEDHIRSYIPFFSETTMEGLNPREVEFEYDWLIRDVATDPAPEPGWIVDWKYEDRYNYLDEGQDYHLRYTGLSEDIEVSTAQSWSDTQLFGGSVDWLPRLMERRRGGQGGLESRFLGILEPHQGTPFIERSVRRPLLSTSTGTPQPASTGGAVHITLADGRTHVIAWAEKDSAQEEWKVEGVDGFRFRGEVAIAKLDRNGELEGLALMNGSSLVYDEAKVSFDDPLSFVEIAVEDSNLRVVTLRPARD